MEKCPKANGYDNPTHGISNQRINGPVSLTWDPVSFWVTKQWPWPLVHVYLHVLILVLDCNIFWEIHYLGIFPYKSIRNQSWP